MNVKCLICGSEKTEIIPEEVYKDAEDPTDDLYGRMSFVPKLVYYQCNNCDVKFIPYTDDEFDNIKNCYKGKYRPTLSVKRSLRWIVPYSKHYNEDVGLVKHLLKRRCRVLDVGSSEGKFLHMLRFRGCKVKGIEPTEQYAWFTKNILRIDVFNGFFEDFETDEKFDLITILTTLEHLKDPEVILKKAHSLLQRDGRIFITVPRAQYSRMHIFLFSEKAISFLLEKTGFEVEDVGPYRNNNRVYAIAGLAR